MGSTPPLAMSSFPYLFLLHRNNTYEACHEGFLGRVAYELHVAAWGPVLKNPMEHITYAPEYDRFEKSGIFDFLEIDNSTVQSLEDVDPTVQHDWKNGIISDVECLAHALRRIFFRRHTNTYTDFEDDDALNVISFLFKECKITTLAVPKACATVIEGTNWFTMRFPDVDQSLRLNYTVDGEEYVLFGSEVMVGDRAYDWE